MKIIKGTTRCLPVRVAVAFILSVQAIAQAGTGRLLSEIALKPLTVTIPARGSVSATEIELLFISDSFLALVDERVGEPGDAHLTLYGIGGGSLRTEKTLNLGQAILPISTSPVTPSKALEWVDSEHFAYWTYLGKFRRWLCDTDLNCREDKHGILPTTLLHPGDCRSEDLLGLVDAARAVCLVPRAHAKSSAIVMDLSGRHLYQVEQGALPWDARLVTSVQGERFGLEWKSNTVLQLLNPLACIDECPPSGRQHFVVFNSSDGKMLRDFEWDPRPFNLDVLPALSPSGKTAAFVRADKLAIYSLDPH